MSTIEATIQPSLRASSPDSQEEQNKELFRRIIKEGFNEGNLAVLDELVSIDSTEHQFFGPDHPQGVEGVKATVRDLHRLFGDFKLTIVDLVTDGDTVWGRMIGEGIHQAEFFGRAPTGKSIKIDVIDICRFKDGKMVEHWGVPDRFHMMMQIGMLPAPAPQLRPVPPPA